MSKQPQPLVSQEITSNIEKMIKQRIVDELFDDPIKKVLPKEKKKLQDEDFFDFTKSKKGLGDLYEAEF